MGMVKDETGNRYGRLTVIRRYEHDGECGQALWVCRCDCGGEKAVRGYDLRHGNTRSCGCLRLENVKNLGKYRRGKPYDMIGERFGMLTVVRRGGRSSTGTKWVCKCDCGNYTEVRGNSLRYGCTHSCGCLRKVRGDGRIAQSP